MSAYDREDVLVARLHALAPHLDGEPDRAFQARTRARLVAMAAVRTPEPAPASALQRLLAARAPKTAPARWRGRLTAGLAGAAMTVTALAGVVAVADGAGPGDVLYDVKRGTEQTQLALAGDSRGQTLLDFASTRLDEVAALVGAGGSALPATPAGPAGHAVSAAGGDAVSAAGGDAALVVETLRTMDEQTTDGASWLAGRAVETGEPRPLDRLARWASGQAGELADLRPLVPQEAADAVEQSLTLLAQIGARTHDLGTALACTAGPSVAGADALGPVPAPCPLPEPALPGSPGSGTPDSATPDSGTPGAGTTGAPPATTAGGGTPGLPGVPAPSGPVPGGGVPSPTPAAPSPATPGLPLPPLPPLPGGPGETSKPGPIIGVPTAPITLCLPPLATLGTC